MNNRMRSSLRTGLLLLGLLLSSVLVAADPATERPLRVVYDPSVSSVTASCVESVLAVTPQEYKDPLKLLVVHGYHNVRYYGLAWTGIGRIDLYVEGLRCDQVSYLLRHELGHLVAEARGLNRHVSYERGEELADMIAEEIFWSAT